jgi:hypothetical protein
LISYSSSPSSLTFRSYHTAISEEWEDSMEKIEGSPLTCGRQVDGASCEENSRIDQRRMKHRKTQSVHTVV